MRSFFIYLQYPAAIVDPAMNKAFSIDHITALTPKTCIASIYHNFHPVSNAFKPIVNRNFNLLNSDSTPTFFFQERSQTSHFFGERNTIKNVVLFFVPANDV